MSLIPRCQAAAFSPTKLASQSSTFQLSRTAATCIVWAPVALLCLIRHRIGLRVRQEIQPRRSCSSKCGEGRRPFSAQVDEMMLHGAGVQICHTRTGMSLALGARVFVAIFLTTSSRHMIVPHEGLKNS